MPTPSRTAAATQAAAAAKRRRGQETRARQLRQDGWIVLSPEVAAGGVAAIRAALCEARSSLGEPLSWIRHLPDDAIEQLVVELGTIPTGTIAGAQQLAQTLTEWRHTAEVYADPELHAVLSSPVEGDFGPVPCP